MRDKSACDHKNPWNTGIVCGTLLPGQRRSDRVFIFSSLQTGTPEILTRGTSTCIFLGNRCACESQKNNSTARFLACFRQMVGCLSQGVYAKLSPSMGRKFKNVVVGIVRPQVTAISPPATCLGHGIRHVPKPMWWNTATFVANKIFSEAAKYRREP